MNTLGNKSFNSEKIQPNLLPSKIIPIGWVNLNSKIKFEICHWTWEIGWIWHLLKKIWWHNSGRVKKHRVFFWRGSRYFSDAWNNSNELPDVNTHKASLFSLQMPKVAYLPSPMTDYEFHFRIQMYSSNRYDFSWN